MPRERAKYERDKTRITPGQIRVLETLRDHGPQRRGRYGNYALNEVVRKGWAEPVWVDDATGKIAPVSWVVEARAVGFHVEIIITESGRLVLGQS